MSSTSWRKTTVNMASMCPAITVAGPTGVVSSRCNVLDLHSSTSTIADVMRLNTANCTIIPGEDWTNLFADLHDLTRPTHSLAYDGVADVAH